MIRKRGAVIFAVVLMAILFAAVILWTNTATADPPFLERANPNGYERVVSATGLLTNDPYPDQGSNRGGETPDLAAYVSANRPALDALREALKLEIEAPAEAYRVETVQIVYNSAGAVKRLAQTLKYEGRLAESEGRHLDAAAMYLELMRFGQKMQAGPMISFLNGLSIEGLGEQSLRQIEPKLENRADRLHVATELEKLNSTRLSLEEILRRERYFTRRNTRTPLHYLFVVYKQRAQMASVRTKYENFHRSVHNLAEKLKTPPARSD